MQKETKVVNIRDRDFDVKVTRKRDNSIPDPPKQGCFGNPYHLHDIYDDAERKRVIDAYRKYFLERVDEDVEFRTAVLDLRGKKLACFCAPKPCHGDVIVKWLEENDS